MFKVVQDQKLSALTNGLGYSVQCRISFNFESLSQCSNKTSLASRCQANKMYGFKQLCSQASLLVGRPKGQMGFADATHALERQQTAFGVLKIKGEQAQFIITPEQQGWFFWQLGQRAFYLGTQASCFRKWSLCKHLTAL